MDAGHRHKRAFPWVSLHHYGGQEVTRRCEPQLSRVGSPQATGVPMPFPGTGLGGHSMELG